MAGVNLIGLFNDSNIPLKKVNAARIESILLA